MHTEHWPNRSFRSALLVLAQTERLFPFPSSCPVSPSESIPASDICSDFAFTLSQDGPAQSSALLKNLGKALPLLKSTVGTVAVIGPNANLSESDSGYYGAHRLDGCGSLSLCVPSVVLSVPATIAALSLSLCMFQCRPPCFHSLRVQC